MKLAAMNILKKIKKYFERKPKFRFLNNGKYKIIEAFRVNGVTYFMFDSIFEIPSGRSFTALTYYDELQMRCSREYLIKHCKAVDTILSDPKKIDIGTVSLLNRNLKDRIEMLPIPEHIYKLASILFFDEQESPYSYDYDYNKNKIEVWRKTEGVLDFFLRTELKNLVPYLRFPSIDMASYLEVTQAVDTMHQRDISQVLSKSE